MHFDTINTTEHPHLSFVSALFHDAFPLSERRDWAQLMEMLYTAKDMCVQVVIDGEAAIGFVIFWDLAEWRFIEYLAVDPACRGMKYGEKIMNALMPGRKILLEIEPPLAVDAQRRVKFYEKAGLSILPYYYRQPSYTDLTIYYDMKLMSNVPATPLAQLNRVLAETLKKVYGTAGIPLERPV